MKAVLIGGSAGRNGQFLLSFQVTMCWRFGAAVFARFTSSPPVLMPALS